MFLSLAQNGSSDSFICKDFQKQAVGPCGRPGYVPDTPFSTASMQFWSFGHSAADIAVCHQLPGLFLHEAQKSRSPNPPDPADALDISQECQLLRMDGPGNGAGRVIGVNIIGVEVLVHSHRAYDRQEILLQQVVKNLGIHPSPRPRNRCPRPWNTSSPPSGDRRPCR